MLIDSRTHSVEDFATGAAVTTVGKPAELPERIAGPTVDRFLGTHPRLDINFPVPWSAVPWSAASDARIAGIRLAWYKEGMKRYGLQMAICLLAGTAAFLFFWSGPGPVAPTVVRSSPQPLRGPAREAPGPAVKPTVPSASPAEFGPSGDAGRLAEENRRLRAQLDDLLGWIVENLSGRYPVPETLLDRLAAPALTADFTLHPDASELLRLGTEEKARIDEALTHAAQVFRRMEMQTARADWLSATEAILHLPADTEGGEALRAELQASFQTVLGPDRGRRLWTVTEAGLSGEFQAFGEEDRLIFFSLVPLPDGVPPLLRIRDERSRPGMGDEPGRETALEWMGGVPPEAYARYMSLLMNDPKGGILE